VKRFSGLESVRPGLLTDPVCAIGVFDGVHRGHRQLIYELEVWAQTVGGESCILTFDRHPLEVLNGVDVPAILSLEARLVELERHRVDAVVVADFEVLKDLEAEAFLEQVVRDRLGCRRLLLGFDSHLGRDRRGRPDNLAAMGEGLGIEVRIASSVLDQQGSKIGSRAIRTAILSGDLERAANLLGRPYAVRGEVVHGAGRGKGLGTATANLEVSGQLLPPHGVYLVRVFRKDETAPGVANLGVRPTFGAGGARTLEVHVPGWSGELYGEQLDIRLIRRLRDERRFEDVAALRAQIAADLEALAEAVANGEV
jgi:riboflavin kinase/FMN adenylyltransferase